MLLFVVLVAILSLLANIALVIIHVDAKSTFRLRLLKLRAELKVSYNTISKLGNDVRRLDNEVRAHRRTPRAPLPAKSTLAQNRQPLGSTMVMDAVVVDGQMKEIEPMKEFS